MRNPDNSHYQPSHYALKYAQRELNQQQAEASSQQRNPRDYTPVIGQHTAQNLATNIEDTENSQTQSKIKKRNTKHKKAKFRKNKNAKEPEQAIGWQDKHQTRKSKILLLLRYLGRYLVQFFYWFRPFNTLRFLGIPIIQRYVIAEFLFSFFISFTFFFFIFLVNALLLLARKYAGEGLPLWAILQLIYYSLPSNISQSLPFSLLVGALMAISHLGASNQMLAFRTCSVRRASLLLPLLICSILAAVCSFIFSDYFLPLGRINQKKIILQLLSNNPRVIINPYSVRSFRNNNGRNTHIISGPVFDETITELIIVDYDEELNRRIFFAKKARLADERPSGVVPFILDEVNASIASNYELEKYSYISADSLLYNVLLGDVVETYRLTPNDRSSWEILRILRETRQEEQSSDHRYNIQTTEYQMHYRSSYKGFYLTTDETLTDDLLESAYRDASDRPRSFYQDRMFTYKMALYLRLAIPFSCIPFMFLAFSLGALAKRYGRTIGFILGIVFSAVFWFSLAGGRLLGRSSNLDIPPFLLMFAGNIFFLLLGMFFILRQKN